MVTRQSWRERAACLGLKPRVVDLLFFHPPEHVNYPHYVASAKRNFCDRCPVKAECLVYALTREAELGPGHVHGVWGGLSEEERKDLLWPRAGQPRWRHG